MYGEAVYQHLSLESVDSAYQDALRSVGIGRGGLNSYETLRTSVGI